MLGGDQEAWLSFSPFWRPDGNLLLFVSPNRVCVCSDGINRVWQVNVAQPLPVTAAPDLLLEEDRCVDSPTWADGRLVVARTTAPDRYTATLRRLQRSSAARVGLMVGQFEHNVLHTTVECGVAAVIRRSEATQDRLVAMIAAMARGEGVLPGDLLGQLLDQVGRL